MQAAPVDNKEVLHHLIVVACKIIHNYSGIFDEIQLSIMTCVKAYIGSHGEHFEH
jgi:hypothetical protein